MITALMRALFVTALIAGCATPNFSAADEARLKRAIADDLAAFPELKDATIDVGAFCEDAVFFQSNFTLDSVFADGPVRYRIEANPDAFAKNLDDEALRGVLAHELSHTLDYETRGKARFLELVPLALLAHENASWERAADLMAIDRGFGPRLLAYRTWLYRVIDKEAVEGKRRIYYSPLEISLLVDVKTRCPALFATFSKAPPLTPREIATECP